MDLIFVRDSRGHELAAFRREDFLGYSTVEFGVGDLQLVIRLANAEEITVDRATVDIDDLARQLQANADD